MKKLTIILSLVLALLASGCSAQSDVKASEVDTKELILDTKEIVAVADEVYRAGREYTAEEEATIEDYETEYGEIEDTDIKLTVNSALMVAYGAKRLDGVEDTFARDFEYVNMLIEEMENGAPLE